MTTVSKNILWSTLTTVLQLYSGSVVFIFLAKLMSVHDYGILSFGFSLSALAVIVSDFGFSLMIMKDYPEQGPKRRKYISNSLLAKVFLALLCLIIFGTYLFFFYEGEWLIVGGIYVLFAIVFSFITYLHAFLKVRNKFHKFTESTVVYAISVTVAVVLYWQLSTSLVQLVWYLLLAKIVNLLWTVYLCKAAFSLSSLELTIVSDLLKKSWSYGLHSILGIFYFMIDTQIISLYYGAEEVALYQSVFRIVLIFLIFSEILSNVLLPHLSHRYYIGEDISELVTKFFRYLLIIGCTLFLFFTSFKNELLEVLYTSKYLEASILVLPFSIIVILRTVSSLLGTILTISDRQVFRVVTVLCSLVVSLVLNFILVPRYGILAAAWISVIVHLILFGMYMVYSKGEIPAMKLLNLTNIALITLTLLFYLTIQLFGATDIIITLVCAIFWVGAVLYIMGQGNNLSFLRQVLREKGVG